MQQENSPDPKIIDLLIRKRFGVLSKEEEVTIDWELARNPNAARFWNELSSMPNDYQEVFTSDSYKAEAWDNIKKKAFKMKMRRNINDAFVLVAGAAILCGIMFLLRNLAIQDRTQSSFQFRSSDITWILPDGNQLNLPDTGKRILRVGLEGPDWPAGTTVTPNLTGKKGYSTLTVPKEMDYRLVLPDGSSVKLNSETEFRFPLSFDGVNRDVYLMKGEAYFDVTQDQVHPFIVHTSQGQIQVLGTTFNVNAYNSQKIIASLLTGKIKVNTPATPGTEISPGFEAIITNSATVLTRFDRKRTIGWLKDVYYFSRASIHEVSSVTQKWFSVSIEIDDPSVQRCHLRGKIYKDRPLQDFINEMNSTGEITLYWKDNNLHCKKGSNYLKTAKPSSGDIPPVR